MKEHQRKQSIISEIKNLCREKGYHVDFRKNGHVTIKGQLTVHFYPFSKDRTAYVQNTLKGHKGCTPKDALLMAETPPKRVHGEVNAKRKSNYRKQRKWLIDKGRDFCHWCGVKLTIDDSTLDHEIPLGRGGLDNRSNYVLACRPCNQCRADKMPEIIGS